ncbi:biotin/lipoyl-containing protein [Streptomonospora nanhaiensis]|uniref:Pyruvate dehydrogenase E2 component (Dihydrolipoamide acetyltransferase) n=1 Tax=Streptomonospora nanhaiensis TaxID=1323731 RepID=A0A853BLD8_9ACTN|nr:biotin/lipoyl-containing protein [Streptomonospora nanhaiensis]MBV2365616.1 biotin attachment protein [Streptomonospora nanhaiensis]MBX9389597.1 biotin attachment protein [Streptomonospora nanhaiensis]NYI95514.1 pyruvate dehydrogenase E2 component (dihydrolipoamide acetyltransferase) [Streptomonospora nanhaiensis]
MSENAPARESTFHLPDLGEGLVEATVLEWLVAPGDRIARNDPLVEVETTKSAAEIPSPATGVVARLHAEAGAVVAVGAPLVTFEVDPEPGGGAPGIVGTVPAEEPTRRRVRLRPPRE